MKMWYTIGYFTYLCMKMKDVKEVSLLAHISLLNTARPHVGLVITVFGDLKVLFDMILLGEKYSFRVIS